MPIDASLLNTLKAADKQLGTDGAHWAQVVGQVTMYVKTLNDYDHKLQKEKDPAKIKGMETFCKGEFAKLKGVWGKWIQTWNAADKSVNFTKAVAANVLKAGQAAKDKVALDWAAKATKNVTITQGGLTQGKAALAKYAKDYQGFLNNKHFK